MTARRRSSAAHIRPAVPPPSLPMPSVPLPVPPLPDSPEQPRQHRDDLEDSPPPSILHPRKLRVPDHHRESRHEPRIPSSRRALTRALELAREAVQLDSTNEEPHAAVMAYGRSVALLSEVMERVRRGEDSTESRSRRSRGPRSAIAQEEEVRRLQNIHDTYADRMNILSIIYNIPPIPYSTTAEYNAMANELNPSASSPTGSQSPTSEIPAPIYTVLDQQDHVQVAIHPDPTSDLDQAASMFYEPSDTSQAAVSHPYASVGYDEPPAPASRPRRPRNHSAAALAPPPPPPSNSLPPAPVPSDPSSSSSNLDVARPGHRRGNSGSRLAPLEEEMVRDELFQQRQFVAERPPDSPPLPPLPSPTGIRHSTPPKAPPSPRMPNIITPRPRGSSYVPTPTPGVINGSTNQGTIFQRRTKSSAPPSSRSSSPAESTTSVNSNPMAKSSAHSSLPGSANSSGVVVHTGRSRSVSQPGRRPSIGNGRISPTPDQRPPLPSVANGLPPMSASAVPRKPSFPSKLNPNLMVQTDLIPPSSMGTLGPPIFGQLPTTPTSPLPPAAPSDPLRKPYHMMNLLRTTMTSPTGGYVTRKLHVPQEVWSQGGAKLANLSDKVRVVAILCSALEDLQTSSSEHFGAGNVSSGLALGIGSIGRKEGEAWLARLEEFSTVCDGVVSNFGKKLGVGEGFVAKKTTWGDKLTRRFDKFTNGKNLDSPAAYVSGLRRLFLHAQLLDEHSQAITSYPVAPAYAALPLDIRTGADNKLKRASQFFATVVLTFVIRDLSQLLDKYAKKCEKWLAE
ncbi:hypothetical protein R3P38DRAFT_2676007 [Favolaschia claudopus]|uniref:MIT domain-containing protein n=1 Tax=Favolaschia claudopus TaxID=2862362 RepID=A0AAW0EJC7_9AGAR